MAKRTAKKAPIKRSSIKKDRVGKEGAALVALFRTKPETLTVCLAAARRSAGAAFLPMIADRIEALS
jgi:hypothetical protein